MKMEHYETEMEAASRCIYELNDIIKKIETSKLTDTELTRELSKLEEIQTVFDHYHVPKDDKNYRSLINTRWNILGLILIISGADVDDLGIERQLLPEWVKEEYL